MAQHLDNEAYYVVLTRGHQGDYECVKTILGSHYRYLGMIGSRLKVRSTFDRLQEEGFSKEQIQTIHAPIGLPIGAATPAEIAISILAEIIQEKNSRSAASISNQLASTTKSGVLCIIIDKNGSSPRGIGSMMFVGETELIDSIGGGAIEHVVIQEARHCRQVMIRDYELNNKDSAKLGMICGGKNRILFISIQQL